MFFSSHKIRLILSGLMILSLSQGFGQSIKIHQEALLLQKALESNHYSPRFLDDTLSKEIFLNYLNKLDPRHLYFTQDDYDSFAPFAIKLDDELKGQAWIFFPLIAKVYRERLLEAEKICKNITNIPFDYMNGDSLIFSPNEKKYAYDEKELQLQWHKWFKYQTLWQMASQVDPEFQGTQKNGFNAIETEIRNKISKVELRKIKRVLEHPDGYENHLKTLYFNSITACFDPHTNYLSKTEFQNFQSQLSSEGFSFGIDLDENENGDIEIIRLVPGGPAWKSNELHKGDVLLKLKWINKQEHDLTGAELFEVENILQSSNTDLMEITARSPVGAVKTVTLKKEKLREDENVVKSYIIKGEKVIGYISLPGFYTDWENPAGHGCANDVAKELVKLKKENIDGLILDLRYNGGGSLYEALNLAGIFIDEGPLLVTQGKDGKANILKDMNRGTVYDGPLLVMVNGQSASASELLASTLQDYNRAVIAGSPTYGKSTGQTILPLDQNMNKNPGYGFLKVTKEKIFRVTGSTAQLAGVRPDIYLPDVYEIFNFREATLPRALSKDSINKKVIFTKLAALPLSFLQDNSKKRLLEHEGFNQIDALLTNFSFTSIKKLKEIPLSLSFFKKLNQENSTWNQTMLNTQNAEVNIFTVENPAINQVIIDADAYGKEVNELLLKNIRSDIYIEESYLILSDLINYSIKQ